MSWGVQQTIPWEIPSDWRPPDLSSLPSWKGVKRIGIDTETRDPDLTRDPPSRNLGPGVRREGSYMVGISFALEDGPAHYLPFRHEGADNLDREAVLRYVRDQAKTYDGTIVGANLQYDLDWLAGSGVEFPKRPWFRDVQIAAPLLWELHNNYSLKSIAERAGVPGKDETKLREVAALMGVDPKADLWKIPAGHVGPYAEQDARLPLQLIRRQERELEDRGLWDIWDLESKVLPVLVKMTRRGVRLDMDGLDQAEVWAAGEEAAMLAVIREHTSVNMGVEDFWKAELCAQALREIGVPVPLTEVEQRPSVTADLLERTDHPVADAILRGRQANKLRSTFVASIREHSVNGRLHCTFNQLKRGKDDRGGGVRGARSGRISAEHVNTQQMYGDRFPELKKRLRSCFLPEVGALWAAPDYSQQEPRLAVHFAYLARCRGATAARDEYKRNPNMDFHAFMAEITGLRRRLAKDVFLGSLYGMGGGKLCEHYLNLPTKMIINQRGQEVKVAGEEGQKIMDQFHQRAPWARALQDACRQAINKKGYVRTLLGRHIHFPKKADGSYDWIHKGPNGLIQGSAADQTKLSMVELDNEGAYLQLQEHDELDGSVADPAEARRWAEIMRDVTPLEVPVKVGCEVGANWGEVVDIG